VLGHFVPYLTPEARDLYEHPEKYFDFAEAERALAEKGQGRPLAEILRDLESSGQPG
jgi:hypothetical protein